MTHCNEAEDLNKFLYEQALREEQFHIDEHQKRIAFFAGLISALLGATIAGVFQAKLRIHFAFLMAGPVLAFALASLAKQAGFRFYKRFLEAITLRAKLEYDLGLYRPRAVGGPWHVREPLVPGRHQAGRIGRANTAQRLRPPGRIVCASRSLWHRLLFGGSARQYVVHGPASYLGDESFVQANQLGGYHRVAAMLFLTAQAACVGLMLLLGYLLVIGGS